MTAGELFSLRGRTALVTGARTGLGRAMAVALAEAGADLLLLGHGGDLSPVTDEVRALGRTANVVTVDLADPDSVVPAAEALLADHRIDVLVNNAGIIRRAPALEHRRRDWDEVLAVNLDSLFLLTQALARPMVSRQSGKIVNIASLLSFQGGITVPGYTASKHAVAGLTKALANEWAPFNVQVNAIAPGYFSTDNTEALRADPQRHDAILARIPAGRWGEGADLAGAVVFLASAASDYVTGQVLAVDGGWLAR
ncbi:MULTISPECIES: 2-dehydro-3-deoxy-D-gluconate 5-dehydrogenase KduD [Actinoalloteichus]|uniref:2-deoxy-D-gluconate 3-dehydrogenase n=1 Tax=Actinoalloteichus fjordicus TaxID=1612552 RepID=A0AAC9LGD2_9PSEU|nr:MULTISPECIES: 2-dehydro-3-deoxy-D-gluconate 5-dehydrogenase KduD [Actinoalloteichus]APU16247.1 2-deoxy-D-gluconate 3-dehydrogenase [Actinoalloteichus fjordicus]APU22307.1 2-deoxy-D-gluconate 3-dehydrogenase [Actinoalloteichus sp. GBA129-24]